MTKHPRQKATTHPRHRGGWRPSSSLSLGPRTLHLALASGSFGIPLPHVLLIPSDRRATTRAKYPSPVSPNCPGISGRGQHGSKSRCVHHSSCGPCVLIFFCFRSRFTVRCQQMPAAQPTARPGPRAQCPARIAHCPAPRPRPSEAMCPPLGLRGSYGGATGRPLGLRSTHWLLGPYQRPSHCPILSP